MTTEPHPLTHEPREIAGSGTALLLLYARRQAGEDAVRSVIETSGVPFTVAELEDTGNWFSQDTKMRLLRALIEVLDDPMAPRKSGYSASENITDNSLVLLLRAFGSPRAVYRKTTMGMSKLSTVADLELLDLGRRTATFRYKMKPGYTATREDCEFALGFMCVTPAMFDLPLATVVHDECEVDGYPACIYRLTWQKYSRFARRKNQSIAATIEVSALRGQLRDLQVAASALVMSEDIDTVRARILDRASTVVQANGHLLLLHDPDFGEPIVTSRGLTPAEEAAAVKKLLRKQDLGASAAVVDVASGRMLHGRLAALRAGGVPISDEDRSLFEAYGHHSAAALELVGALTGSRSETSRARALLTLAKDLAGAVDDISVARIAASALPRISDGRASGVLLWDSATGVLKVVATAGHDEKQRLALEGREISTETTPELRAFLTERKPTVIEAATASPALSTLIGDAGSGAVVVVPLIAGDELMGVVTVGWQMNLAAQPLHEALSRVTGVADQVATALQNVRLLATVRHQANHDALSGLPNRVLFSRVLEGELRRAVPDQSTAVLFCDLDQFKQVNDRLGHAAGDEVLRQVSIRLREQVRDKDTVARLSGDEFAVVLTDVADELQAVTVARRIVECLDQPLRIDGHEVRITSSVGVALHTGPDGRAERLLAAADAAMYSAKKRGRDQVAVSGEVENNHALPSLEAELSMAAGNGELRLHFQPVVDVSGGSEGVVVGAEALLRWQHPRLGLLAPGSFLPLAEDAGLVTGLDLWALQAACAALATWEPGVRGPHRIAVNLAADTLVDRRLLPAVRNALTTHRIAPDQLHLEVVESRSLTDVPGVVDRLVELRQLGVSISLDDFGTGFSTLAWLQTLPVDQIKIDRTFVMALTEGGSIALIRGVVALANELGISVVAEGVEEPHQLAMLREAGCTLVQGYLLGRPEPEFADEVLPFTGRVHTHG